MTARPYFAVPAHEIPLHPDSARFAEPLRSCATTYSKRWEVASVASGWGVAVFDARDTNGRTEAVTSRRYQPRLNGATSAWPHRWWQFPWNDGRIPWAKAWDKRLPKGTDALVVVVNPDTGERWSLWQPRREWGRLVISHGGLVAKVTVDRDGEPTELRDAKGRYVPADTRVDGVNAPFSNGAGIVGWYPNDDDLARPVERALSICFEPETLGETVAVAPAAQQEPRSDGRPGPMLSGPHVAWNGVGDALARHLPDIAPEHRERVVNLCIGMSRDPVMVNGVERPGFGAYSTMTGGNNRIVLGFSDLPDDCVSAIAADVEWVTLAPPHGFLDGRDMGTGPGWREAFAWT